MKIQMTVQFEIEDGKFFDESDAEMRDWCFDTLLKDSIIIHSNEIGETLAESGTVNVIEAKEI